MESHKKYLEGVTIPERIITWRIRARFAERVIYFWGLAVVIGWILGGPSSLLKFGISLGIIITTDLIGTKLLLPHYTTYLLKEEVAIRLWARDQAKLLRDFTEDVNPSQLDKEEKKEDE